MIRIATAAPDDDGDDNDGIEGKIGRETGYNANHKKKERDMENNGERREELITARQFAALLQVSLRTLWRLVSTGKAPEPIKLHGSTRWVLSEVMKWIRAGCPPQAKAKQ